MGQKDLSEKILEDYNDVFADIINGLIFHGEQRYTDIAMENGREVHSMCEVAERLERVGFTKGRTEGRAEGRAEEIIETGHEFGLSEDAILARLQKKLNISMQKAQEYLAMFGRQGV